MPRPRSQLSKRCFDIIIIVATAPVWLPVLLVTAALVRTQLGAPVFFRQKRPGYRGQVFEMVKFRSMSDARDAAGQLLPDDRRLGAFGKLLRSSSLDELPEIWNVLRGEMSLVGPRPLLLEYMPLYNAEQARRHDVLPGITGWAQINGRNAISWAKKFEYDVWYVDHQSLLLDIRILLLTIVKVFRRSDISEQGEATARPFTGNHD